MSRNPLIKTLTHVIVFNGESVPSFPHWLDASQMPSAPPIPEYQGDGEEDALGCVDDDDDGGHRGVPASEVESYKNRLVHLINMVHSRLQRQPRVQLTFLFTVRGRRGCCGEGVASTKMTIILKNGEPWKTVGLCRTTLSHSAKTQCYAWCSSVAKLVVAAAFVSPLFILISGLERIVRPFHNPMVTGMLILYLYCNLKEAAWCELGGILDGCMSNSLDFMVLAAFN